MKTRYIAAAATLISALSAPAFSAAISTADVLYTGASFNTNLDDGEYDFASQHATYGSKFVDRWKFTVADSSTASISIYDLETSFGKPVSIKPAKFRQLKQNRPQINTSKIFDTTGLTLSIYNPRGKLIASAGENETLENLNLIAGKWYTIEVRGKVNGFFGSSYHGVLDINPTPVPLSDSAPLLGSALALLALRKRLTVKAVA